MYKCVGIRPSSFNGNDGQTVNGKNLYFVYPLESGEGHGTERVFMTVDKLSTCTVVPKVNDVVDIIYNRYGKVSDFRTSG